MLPGYISHNVLCQKTLLHNFDRKEIVRDYSSFIFMDSFTKEWNL